jgi:apolipoprotein N-acyltransferase
MTTLLRCPALLSLVLGALAACGFAPLALWPLTIACLAAWIALVHAAPSLKIALWRGWLFGVGHFTINDNWFQHAFDFQDKMPPALGYAAPLALALYLAVYPSLAAGIAWWLRGRKPDAAFALVFGAAWIVSEWLRSVVFTGYAWDPIGVIWVPVQPVAALTSYVGTYALSGLTVLLAGLLLLLPRRPMPLIAAAAGFALLVAAQALSYRQFATPAAIPADAPRIVVVQPNIAQDATGEVDAEAMLARLIRLSGEPRPYPRLVTWPEGVVRQFIEEGYPEYAYGADDPYAIRRRMAATLGPRDMLLAGGTALQFNDAGNAVSAANSVFALNPQARITARYDKAHLVPYGEYLPMPWLLKPLGLDKILPGNIDALAGPGPRALELPGFGRVGVQVCYEIIFSGQVIGPERPRLLFNPSNDAWFGKWGPPQHLAQARMRAIEEGLPIVRATPTGISAVIGANGALLATIPHERAGRFEVAMPAALPPTLFSRLGNLAAALVAATLLAGAIALRRRAR